MSGRMVNTPLRILGAPSRGFAAQSAPKKTRDLPSGQTPVGLSGVRETKLPNGLTIAALEYLSPISRIGIFVRAGARFETPSTLGVTHALRTTTGLSTKTSTTFGITRNIDYLGGTLTTTSTREEMIYVLSAQRDVVGSTIKYLGDIITRPAFKPWELEDFIKGRMAVERKRLKLNPEARLMELLHEAAYKGSLSNSLYSPKYMLGKHDHNMLMSYVEDHYAPSRIAIVGLGVELEPLVEGVEKNFEMKQSAAPEPPKSKFVGGNVRIGTNSNVTLVAVAAEGTPIKNGKEVIALSLFQQLLGVGPRIRYSDAQATSIAAAAAKATKSPVAASSLNISYSDTGLFGFVAAADPEDVHNVTRAIVSRMREVAKGLKDNQLNTAKHQLKASLLMSLEDQNQLLEEIGFQSLHVGRVVPTKDMISAIDATTLNDISEVANRVMKGKVAIAAVGKVHNVPHLEDLL